MPWAGMASGCGPGRSSCQVHSARSFPWPPATFSTCPSAASVPRRSGLPEGHMALSAARIEEFAQTLEAAALQRRSVTKITDEAPDLAMSEAYDIQWALRRRRLNAGCRLTGLKMGLT